MEDMETSFAIWMDPKVTQFSGGPAREEQVRKGFLADLALRDSDYGFRTVIETASGLHIGDCGLLKKEIESKAEIELVYFFHSNFWGKGYATEAAQALFTHAFAKLALKRLVSLIHPENTASKSVAMKVGMMFERNVVTAKGNLREMFSKNCP